MKVTNKHNAPQSLVRFAEMEHHTSGGADITVTGLMDSPQIRSLKGRHGELMETDVYESPWALMGTALHYVVEAAAKSQSDCGGRTITEERILTKIDVDGKTFTLSGGIDIQQVEVSDQGDPVVIIGDYKLTNCFAIKDPSTLKKWSQQLNLYRYLVEREKGWTVVGLHIYALLRDWVRAKKSITSYPAQPGLTVDFDLWTDEDLQRYVDTRMFEHFGKPERQFICTDEERWHRGESWKVKKVGGKRATHVTKTESEANEALERLDPRGDGKYSVEHHPGQFTRCENDYCGVARWCEQWNGDLVDLDIPF